MPIKQKLVLLLFLLTTKSFDIWIHMHIHFIHHQLFQHKRQTKTTDDTTLCYKYRDK